MIPGAIKESWMSQWETPKDIHSQDVLQGKDNVGTRTPAVIHLFITWRKTKLCYLVVYTEVEILDCVDSDSYALLILWYLCVLMLVCAPNK